MCLDLCWRVLVGAGARLTATLGSCRWSSLQGLVSIGDITAFLMYSVYCGMAIGGLTAFYAAVMKGVGASERLWALMDRQPAMPLRGGLVLPEVSVAARVRCA